MTDHPPDPPVDNDSAESPAGPKASLLDRLGPRAVRRMTPRVGVAIAGAGALIAVGGATGLGGEQLVGDDGDVQRIPGIVLSAIVIIAGYVTMARVRSGPLATAGATGAALGFPVLLFFLTFSESDFPPFSLDAILLVSSMAWLAAYLVGPGMGRLLFLGAALLGSWLFVLNLVEPVEQLSPFGMFGAGMSQSVETSSGFGEGFGEPTIDDETGEVTFPEPVIEEDFGTGLEDDFSFDAPSFNDVAVVSLLFGVAYAVAALVLSRRGYPGAGTPFAAVAIVALLVGVQLLSPELEQTGTGFLSIGIGFGLAAFGAASGRRVTAWFGAAGVGVGAIAILQEAVEEGSASSQSFAFLVLGIAVVIGGHLLSVALGEPAEEDLAPSFAGRTATGPGLGGPAPYEVDLEDE